MDSRWFLNHINSALDVAHICLASFDFHLLDTFLFGDYKWKSSFVVSGKISAGMTREVFLSHCCPTSGRAWTNAILTNANQLNWQWCTSRMHITFITSTISGTFLFCHKNLTLSSEVSEFSKQVMRYYWLCDYNSLLFVLLSVRFSDKQLPLQINGSKCFSRILLLVVLFLFSVC